MKKEGKKRGGKVVAGSATAVVLAVLAMFGGRAFGFGGGAGTGEDGTGVNNEQSVSSDMQDNTEATSATTAEGEELETIIIEVMRSNYLIAGEKKTLSEVELIVRRADPLKTTFILEDNYASSKAWDDVREIFINLGIGVVEQ